MAELEMAEQFSYRSEIGERPIATRMGFQSQLLRHCAPNAASAKLLRVHIILPAQPIEHIAGTPSCYSGIGTQPLLSLLDDGDAPAHRSSLA